MIKNLSKLVFITALFLTSIHAIGQNVRGFYLQDVGNWLGDLSEENKILNYAQGNGFNYILFYDLGSINWNSASEKNKLGAFISRARNQFGVTEVGGVVEYAGYVSNYLIPYNNSRTNNSEKFDVMNMEFEFWVSSSVSNSYCSKFLSPAGYSCDSAGAFAFCWKEFKKIDSICAANSLISEFYLGWPNQGQMQKIASRADRIFISAYRQTDSDVYSVSKNRFKYIATLGGTTKVISLFSSEPSFMGSWLNSHPLTKPFQTMSTDLANETAAFAQNIDLQGYNWFTYKFMPYTMLNTAMITANGPLSFCQGGSVVLTGSSGASFLWSPGGQTTQSITVSTPGTYSVRVTNANGVAVLSPPVIVSYLSGGTAPTITPSGSTAFCSGGSVTLSSSTANSYLWSTGATTQAITVSTSGTYSVTAGSGSCSVASSPIVVNANAAQVPPVITASGSTSVCPGTVLILTSTQANAYQWSNGATTRSIAVSTAGNFDVTTNNGPNCSAQSTPASIILLPAPARPTISPTGSTNLTATHPSVTLVSSYASSYSWSTGSNARSIDVTAQGAYRVTIVGPNGCSATSNQITIKANGCVPPVAPTITASGSNIISSGQSITLTSSLSSGYRWSNGQTTQSITVTAAGTFDVRSYNGGGCYSTSLPVTVTMLTPRIASSDIDKNETSESTINFTVYPNPADEILNVVFNRDSESKLSLKLIDISGRELMNRNIDAVSGENQIQLDVSSFPKGIYFACLMNESQRKMLKVIVQ